MDIKSYLVPKSINECLEYLNQNKGEARLIAGGTDLVLWIKKKKIRVKTLIDVTKIPGLDNLKLNEGKLIIGAAVTHTRIATHPYIRKVLPILSKACESVGSPQVRNIATLTGNIVSAQPAADSAIALIALGAKVEIVSLSGPRIELVENLYKGMGKSKVDSSQEIISKIIIEIPCKDFRTVFLRISPRSALSLPIINVAVCLSVKDEKVDNARICMGPVSYCPFRPVRAESMLKGINLKDKEAIAEVAICASQEANPRDSLLRGSKNYRKVLVKSLVNDALLKLQKIKKLGG